VAKRLIDGYDALFADLDGVVYEGGKAIEHAVESLRSIQAERIALAYVTNNSSRKPETIAEQISAYGIKVLPAEVVSSGQTGVELLSTLVEPGSKILVVGGEGLRTYTEQAGFQLVEDSTQNPAAVIQGFSPDVGWKHLSEAAFAIQNGAKWVATNSDWTIPQERGIAPGNGTLVSAVHTAVGLLPLVAGKPEIAIFETAMRRFSVSRPLFVGDRIDTDILGANRAGIDSVLVLTGISKPKELLATRDDSNPKFIIADLRELLVPYVQPKATKYGFSLREAAVELLGNKVRVTSGDPKGIDALRCACALIWGSGKAIHTLDVEPSLYE
jgi:HAD superfamily hydrolase (TIGR01450 family)